MLCTFFHVEEVNFGDSAAPKISEAEVGGKLFNLNLNGADVSKYDDNSCRIFQLTNKSFFF